MRILVWSDGGAHTGYGTVVENLGRRWHRRGADVHVLAVNYRGDPWPGPLKLYAATKNNPRDGFGVGRLGELVQRLRPDVLFVLEDLYTVVDGFRALKGRWPVPTVLYVPIDGIGLPRAWWPPVQAADVVVAMAEHGQRVMKREAGIEADVLLHGVDHEAMFPASDERPLVVVEGDKERAVHSQEEAKELLGLKGRFVVLGVNRNTIRKNYYDTFRVFDRFRRHRNDAFLYVHAVARDEGGDLGQLAARYGLTRTHAYVHNSGDTFTGSATSTLALLYNAADVKLTTSMAEGFGLTDAEALSCGLPVVAQDFSAMHDVIGPGGILVPSQRYFTTTRMVDFALPNLEAMLAALEQLYADRALRRRLSARAIKHAKRYDWDVTADGLFAHFERLAEARSVPQSIVVDAAASLHQPPPEPAG
jgi:glycosyltransferase involved in cell wall biosynthesis